MSIACKFIKKSIPQFRSYLRLTPHQPTPYHYVVRTKAPLYFSTPQIPHNGKFIYSFESLSSKQRKKIIGFVDFFSLKYFSYIVAILQRSGHKLFYWCIFSNIAQGAMLYLDRKLKEQCTTNQSLNLKIPNNHGKGTLICSENFVFNFILLLWSKNNTFGYPILDTTGLDKSVIKSTILPPSQFTQSLCSALKMSYMVRYKALDRKLRKIVKNKYRYFRFYAMINPHNRVKAGLRLLLLGLSLRSNQKVGSRLMDLLVELYLTPSDSLLLNLRKRHQVLTLTTLTLAL